MEDLEEFGAPPEAIADARAAFTRSVQPDAFPIMPVNETAVRLFLALSTQWKTTALSTMSSARLVRIGLDYGVVEPTARLAGLDLGEGDFRRLQILEASALKAWSEEAAAKR